MSAFAFGPPRPGHPLDVELADLVEGAVDETRTAELEAHLAVCLLCRIKRRRLGDAPPAPLDGDRLLPGPTFPVPAGDDAGGAQPATGDLWLVGGDDSRMLVLVLRGLGDRVLVAPVTFDVEAADDETVIVDAGRSPLRTELVIYRALATEIPTTLLTGRMGALAPDVLGSGTRGSAIEGRSDPRLEVRQFLADRLGSMEEQPPDPATAADAPPQPAAHVRSSLIADLRELRGDTCAVRPLYDWGDILPAHQAGWEPIATVDEVGIVLIVLDTPHGLADDTDFNAARAVLTRFNATALVILATGVSVLADVFDSPSLNYGIDAPSGQHTPPRPLISAMAPFDAIGKFLDQTTGARFASPPSRGPIARVDVGEILREAGSVALADAVRQAARFKIAPKRRGYESVSDAEERFQAVLGRAFDPDNEALAQALVDLAVPPQGDA